ncbi:twin-arginine translocase subunit TatC [Georgenia yuyongxinii]
MSATDRARSRKKNPEGRMPLGDHLRELRRRVMWAAVGILVGAVAGWLLYDPLLGAMTAPLEVIAEQGREAALNFGTVGSAFDLKVQVSIFLGLFISSPWWIGQLWMFVTPGLTRRERLYSLSFIVSGALLFVAGGAMAWWVLPHAVEILTSFTPTMALNLMDARTYFTFFMRVILAFGVAFLLPVIMVGLNFLGVVSGRTYLKAWRWAVLGAFVFAAFANPLPDAWSMIAMAAPICALYFGAVGISFLRDRRVAKRRASQDAADAAAGL